VRIYYAGRTLKKVGLCEDFHENLRAYWKRADHAEIASIEAYLTHASVYSRVRGRVHDFDVGHEWKPSRPPAFFFSFTIIRL
jgi:hypothetical protein